MAANKRRAGSAGRLRWPEFNPSKWPAQPALLLLRCVPSIGLRQYDGLSWRTSSAALALLT